MLAAVKGLLYLGTTLLIGAGVFSRLVGSDLYRGPQLRRSRTIVVGALLGAGLLTAASALDLLLTVRTTLGFVDQALLSEYLRFSRHGAAIQLRLVLLLLVTALVLVGGRSQRRWIRGGTGAAFVALSTALLATFSWISHAVAMEGRVPMLADLVHFASAAFWGGSLLYLALLPVWRQPSKALVSAIDRLSMAGIASITALALTGTYAALLHIWSPQVLTGSPYGRTLILKLALVALIIAVATLNRLWLLPAVRRASGGEAAGSTRLLGRLVRGEALLLTAVFIVTGALTTSSLPHL